MSGMPSMTALLGIGCCGGVADHNHPCYPSLKEARRRTVTIFRIFEQDSTLEYWTDARSEREARRRVLKQIPTLSDEEIECRIDTPDLTVPFGVVVVSIRPKEQSVVRSAPNA